MLFRSAHVQEHIDLLRNTDPAVLQLIGQQSIAAPMPPQGAPGGPPAGGGPSNVLEPESENANTITNDLSNNVNLPSIPEPPAPFENLPVQASDLQPNR